MYWTNVPVNQKSCVNNTCCANFSPEHKHVCRTSRVSNQSHESNNFRNGFSPEQKCDVKTCASPLANMCSDGQQLKSVPMLSFSCLLVSVNSADNLTADCHPLNLQHLLDHFTTDQIESFSFNVVKCAQHVRCFENDTLANIVEQKQLVHCQPAFQN